MTFSAKIKLKELITSRPTPAKEIKKLKKKFSRQKKGSDVRKSDLLKRKVLDNRK